MTLLLFLGLILTGVAAAFAVRTVAFERLRRRETLAQIAAYGFDARELAPPDRASLRQLLDGLATSLGRIVYRGKSEAQKRELRLLLRSAGYYRANPETFIGYRIGVTASLAVLCLWLTASAGVLGLVALLLIGMGAGLGWVLP